MRKIAVVLALMFSAAGCSSALSGAQASVYAIIDTLKEVCPVETAQCEVARHAVNVAVIAYNTAESADKQGAPNALELVNVAIAAIDEAIKAVKAVSK